MEFPRRIQALFLSLLLATTVLALAPGAQASVEPVECAHGILETYTTSMSWVCLGGLSTPGTPVGASLICNYGAGEVGAEVHAGPLSVPLCYAVDPTACGGDPGVTLFENGKGYTQCVDPGACGSGFGQETTPSVSWLGNHACVDPFAPCGVDTDLHPPLPPYMAPSSTAIGCIPILYVATSACPGLVGTKVAVGHPITGDLVDFCF